MSSGLVVAIYFFSYTLKEVLVKIILELETDGVNFNRTLPSLISASKKETGELPTFKEPYSVNVTSVPLCKIKISPK
jgi:hypothetical protein